MVIYHNCYWGYDSKKYCRKCGHRRGCTDHKAFLNAGGSVGSSDLLVACEAPTAFPETTVHSSPLVARDGCNREPGGECPVCHEEFDTDADFVDHILGESW